MAHEERLEKYRKSDDFKANVAQFSNQSQSRRGDNARNQNFNNRGGRSSRGGGRFNQNGGKSSFHGGRSNFNTERHMCQLCGKISRVVMDCWHRYDQNFVPQPRNPRPVQMRPLANFSMANSAATSTTLVDPS